MYACNSAGLPVAVEYDYRVEAVIEGTSSSSDVLSNSVVSTQLGVAEFSSLQFDHALPGRYYMKFMLEGLDFTASAPSSAVTVTLDADELFFVYQPANDAAIYSPSSAIPGYLVGSDYLLVKVTVTIPGGARLANKEVTFGIEPDMAYDESCASSCIIVCVVWLCVLMRRAQHCAGVTRNRVVRMPSYPLPPIIS